MKKLLLLLVFSHQILYAQQIEVLSISQLKTPDGQSLYYPVFDNENQQLLVTQENYKGLQLYSINKGTLTTISTDNGAGYGAQISEDGTKIVYKKNTLKNNLRFNSLHEYSLKTNKSKQLVSPTRESITAQKSKTSVDYVKGTKMVCDKKLKSTDGVRYILQIENQKMVLYNDGHRQVLIPNAESDSYFWASISPDQKHIVYTVAGKGTFVCNINGKTPKSLGKIGAPKWLSNDWIIGMDDIDDGEKLISSTIVAITKDGKRRQTLTTSSEGCAMYPTASNDGSQITFNTDKGKLYIMNIQFK